MDTPEVPPRAATARSHGVATIVFVDAEGSTELVERVGDGTGTAALVGRLDVVRERIEAYGGREVKALGDGLMLWFDSPRNALTFSLATQRALGNHRPQMRIGINAGEVVDRDGDPMGTTVNAAARICARAKGGDVVVSDVVRLLAGNVGSVRYHDRGRVHLKGLSERWHLWSAEDGIPPSPERPTIGRAAEREAIATLLAATLAGTGGTVLIEGEAGIGKTHLISQATEHATRLGLITVTATADEMMTRPGVVLHALALERSEAVRPLSDVLNATVHTEDASDRSFAAVEAGVDAVEHLTRNRPGLIIVDDAQWLDELSLALLRAIARRARSLPVAIVVAFRSTPRPRSLDRLIDTVTDLCDAHQRVGPLSDADVQALATDLTGAAPGVGLRRRLASTAGNPLFITELLRLLDDDGQLEIAEGVVDAAGAAMPAGLNETLVRRLSWLSRPTIDLLRLASLLGTSFTLANVATVTGRSIIEVAAGLREASVGGIISGDGDRLTFRHDLVREAVYGDMVPAERRDLHGAAARALANSGASLQQVANQFGRAAQQGDLVAVDWLRRAADEVVCIAPSTGVALYEQALELAPELWPDRGAILARMVEPLAWSGHLARAEAAADAVLSSSSDDRVVFEALRGLGAVHGNRGDIAAAIAALQRAVDHPGAPPEERVRLGCFMAQLQMLTGAIPAEQAKQIAERTLEVAVAGDDATSQCIAHQVLGLVGIFTGHSHEGELQTRSAVDLFESGRVRPTSYMVPDLFHAMALVELDRFDDALHACALARDLHTRRGALTQLPMGLAIPASLHVFRGAHDEADADIEAGLAIIDDTDSMNFMLYFLALRSRLALRRGDLDGARSEVEHGMAILASGNTLFGADWLLDAQVHCLWADGDENGALALAETTWEQTAFMRSFHGGLERGVDLVRLASMRQRIDLATSVAAEVDEMALRRQTESSTAAALWSRGLAGRDHSALMQAVEHYRCTERRPALALCCEDAAGLAREHPDAVALLREAAAIHADIGASGDLARVNAALRARGSAPRRTPAVRPTFGWGSLTPMEATVTELVAEGLTNPEVGARLFISRRTVETHLSHVFRKLDCTSRTQLAAAHLRRIALEGG